MSEQFADFESMLRRALVPVDPPEELEARLELTLGTLVDMAAEELDALEISADARSAQLDRGWPARWPPPGSAPAAAVGLVLVRTRRRRHKRRREARGSVDLVGRTLRDFSREARRVVDDIF